uniref:Taste receptor type 2 n=1 Tax=Pyxicephalus adspersus TaxID=30357 RepID=A0AAV3AU16_PYXAD|nr:TPA: hypothetical protein GDO54_009902 [Pyxicephalus adspersus]
MIVQSFIIALNLIDHLKGKLMTATDKIITSLGISRLAFHLICLFIIVQLFVSGTEPVMYSYITLSFIAWLLSGSSIWLSALLSVFLCLKISNFNNVFFLRLRGLISQNLTRIIVLSILCSGGYSSLYFMVVYDGQPNNSTEAQPNGLRRPEVKQFLLLLWNIICFLVYFLSSLLIIISLCLHMSRIKTEKNATCKMGTYIKTLTFIVVTFLTCAAFSILSQFDDYLFTTFGILVFHIIWNLFPILHSIYLLCANAKLRNGLFRLQC